MIQYKVQSLCGLDCQRGVGSLCGRKISRERHPPMITSQEDLQPPAKLRGTVQVQDSCTLLIMCARRLISAPVTTHASTFPREYRSELRLLRDRDRTPRDLGGPVRRLFLVAIVERSPAPRPYDYDHLPNGPLPQHLSLLHISCCSGPIPLGHTQYTIG